MACPKAENQVAGSANKLLIKSLLSVVLCAGSVVFAQAQEAQRNTTDESWSATTQISVDGTNPSRTTESHAKYGNRTVDNQRVEVLGTDGRYVPSSDTEKETIRINATTIRTVVRIYAWDGNGKRKLVHVTEEEARSTASGDVRTVRTTSNSDVNGNLQVVQRETADMKKTSPDAQETETFVYIADGNGGFTASLHTKELQKRSADDRVEVSRTTLLPDGNGRWAVSEVREKTIKQEGKKRTTEERISLPDSEGRFSEVSRTVGEETETATGERTNTVNAYSKVVPGVAGDGSLHLNQRVTTLQKKDSDGETTEQQVEQPDPGNPNVGLQVSAKTKYIVQYAASGAQQTKTVQARNSYGNFYVVYFETRKSGQVPPVQVLKAPSDKPQ